MLFFYWITLVVATDLAQIENASYKNSNPRPYDNCEANDLIKLSACCNSVLADLDDCKAGDLACECCALQSMDASCYNICPGNPSTNFLSVLFDDCSSLNDVNACNIPFKRVDGDRPSSFKAKVANEMASPSTASFKSQLKDLDEEDAGEMQFKQRPHLNLINNATNMTALSPSSSSSLSVQVGLTAMIVGAIAYLTL